LIHTVLALVLSAITVMINDATLPLEPPARTYAGRLYVPVRHTIEALGLQFNISGRTIWTQIGSKTVSLSTGSKGLIELKGVLYAPLRFFTDVLGAQTSFDPKSNRVSIVAQLMGREGAGLVEHGKNPERYGTVSAVDVNSDPPTVTLNYNAAVHTIPIGANAQIDLHDVNANVAVAGELSDVRPGDFARLYYDEHGRVKRVEDEFGSYAGKVAAAASDVFVLDDGHVISPARTTQVSINGRVGTFSDVRVGDRANIRYNIESNEIRSILIGRDTAPLASATPSSVTISAIDVAPDRALQAGSTISVTLHGTPGGAASFDLGSYVSNIAMSERASGTYVGDYQLPRSANFSGAPIIGHLRVGNNGAPDVVSAHIVSVASLPPGIADFAPGENAWVNTNRPAIYVTFATDAVDVNPSSIVLWVNGRDVTASCVRTDQYVQYMPSYSYPKGPVKVTVRVADRAGNVTTKSWTFTIHK
jgi:hypothetical protein